LKFLKPWEKSWEKILLLSVLHYPSLEAISVVALNNPGGVLHMIVANGKVEEHVLWSSNAASIVMCICADVLLGGVGGEESDTC
jgi:hypothetical protein